MGEPPAASAPSSGLRPPSLPTGRRAIRLDSLFSPGMRRPDRGSRFEISVSGWDRRDVSRHRYPGRERMWRRVSKAGREVVACWHAYCGMYGSVRLLTVAPYLFWLSLFGRARRLSGLASNSLTVVREEALTH